MSFQPVTLQPSTYAAVRRALLEAGLGYAVVTAEGRERLRLRFVDLTEAGDGPPPSARVLEALRAAGAPLTTASLMAAAHGGSDFYWTLKGLVATGQVARYTRPRSKQRWYALPGVPPPPEADAPPEDREPPRPARIAPRPAQAMPARPDAALLPRPSGTRCGGPGVDPVHDPCPRGAWLADPRDGRCPACLEVFRRRRINGRRLTDEETTARREPPRSEWG